MTERLPIVISASADLAATIVNIDSIVNKMAAQLNFHAMRANWFGDEDNVLSINLFLSTANEFEQVQQSIEAQLQQTLADDVFLLTPLQNQLDCYIAITEKERQLLLQQPKLVVGYTQTKLTKVLNVVAKQRQLSEI